MPLKEGFITYISQEKGACHTTQGHERSTRFGQEAEAGTKGNRGQTPYWGFHGEGKAVPNW